MHNRGNGKGGGIAAVGFVPEALGVSQEILDSHYMLQVALIDPKDKAAAKAVEDKFILPWLDIAKSEKIPTVADYRDIPGLDVQPPDVMRYFVRVKKDVLRDFTAKNHFENLKPGRAEDEFMCQNAFKLNTRFYSTLGDKKAFVMSHGKNMMILKIVGYAELVASYYQLEDFKSHIWIAHQRYPTKGRVWHPGGAHPFSGMHEALVHNGDFANYHSVCEYLKQRSFFPLFHTDTEASVLMLDLLNRVYEYPLEYIIEALAPTTEADFDQLPPDKQKIYRAIQAAHIHGSPDGPWFFIIARNDPYQKHVPADRHYRYGHAAASGVCAPGRGGPDRAGVFGKTGHRRHARQPGQGRSALLSGVRQVLERPRRQPYGRRHLCLYRQAGKRRHAPDLFR